MNSTLKMVIVIVLGIVGVMLAINIIKGILAMLLPILIVGGVLFVVYKLATGPAIGGGKNKTLL